MVDSQQIKQLLADYKIPVESWGAGEAKTFDHLLKELSEGEARLEKRDQKLIRVCEGSTLTVKYISPDNEVLVLVEDHQRFHDGRTRTRNLGGQSIGEKMRPGESPFGAAYRALAEELGIDQKLPLHSKSPREKTAQSQSYPGLWVSYLMHHFEVYLTDEVYHPSGYTEKQPDKSTVFLWQKQGTKS